MRSVLVAVVLVLCACGSHRDAAPVADTQDVQRVADQQLLSDVAALRARKAELEAMAAQRPRDEQQISANASVLGDAGDPTEFLMRLQEVAFELNMELVRLAPLPEVLHETYVETAYDVTLRGRFAAVLPFLRAIARSGIAVVEELRLEPGADALGRPNVSGTFRLRTFRWATAPAPGAKPKARLPDDVPHPRRIVNTARVSLDDELLEVADPFVARPVPAGGVGAAEPGRPPAPCVFDPYVLPSSDRRVTAVVPRPVPALPLDAAQRTALQEERAALTAATANADELERAARALENRARTAREIAAADAVPVWMLVDLARVIDGQPPRIMGSQVAECLDQHPEAKPATTAGVVWLASFVEHAGELTLTGHAASHAALRQLALRLNTSLHFSRIAVQAGDPEPGGTLPFTITALVAY